MRNTKETLFFLHFIAAEKPHFIKMPQDATIHDYADFNTKARAEGIPKPTLHWLKDGKQIKVDDTNFSMEFGSASDLQVSSDFAIAHFGKSCEGTVSITIK